MWPAGCLSSSAKGSGQQFTGEPPYHPIPSHPIHTLPYHLIAAKQRTFAWGRLGPEVGVKKLRWRDGTVEWQQKNSAWSNWHQIVEGTGEAALSRSNNGPEDWEWDGDGSRDRDRGRLSVAGAQWPGRQLSIAFVRSAYVIHIQLRSQFSIVGRKMRNVGAKSAVQEKSFQKFEWFVTARHWKLFKGQNFWQALYG